MARGCFLARRMAWEVYEIRDSNRTIFGPSKVSNPTPATWKATKEYLNSEEPRRVVSKRVVLADVPPERKPERGYVRQNHPFTKPPFYLPVTIFGVDKRVVSKRVVSADVPPERKPERAYVRQNHPFTKPPFYLPVINHKGTKIRVFRVRFFGLLSSQTFFTLIFPQFRHLSVRSHLLIVFLVLECRVGS